jgi:hypothetical protein
LYSLTSDPIDELQMVVWDPAEGEGLMYRKSADARPGRGVGVVLSYNKYEHPISARDGGGIVGLKGFVRKAFHLCVLGIIHRGTISMSIILHVSAGEGRRLQAGGGGELKNVAAL